MTTAQNNTKRKNKPYGKAINADVRIKKVKIIIGDEEITVDRYKIVATWLNPKDQSKPTYAFTLHMIVETLLQSGINVDTPLQAIRIKVNSIYRKCRELKVYDNSPENPYPILAWWQDGQWLPVAHPDAKKLGNQ